MIDNKYLHSKHFGFEGAWDSENCRTALHSATKLYTEKTDAGLCSRLIMSGHAYSEGFWVEYCEPGKHTFKPVKFPDVVLLEKIYNS